MNSTVEVVFREVEERFEPIWAYPEYYDYDYSDALFDAFQLCNEIRTELGFPPYTRETFDDGVQYRNIFHPEWEVAVEEFANVVLGWW